MEAQRVALDYERVLGFVGHAYDTSDAVLGIDIGSVFHTAAGACAGTDLVDGLGNHAVEQSDKVRALAQGLDRYAETTKHAIDALRRISESRTDPLPTSTDHDPWA